MALVLKDRVKVTSTTTGTGTLTLGAASTGYQDFTVIGNGNITFYTIALQNSTEWEVGIGTYASAGNTLSRDTVLESSNAGALVNFSAGAKDVFVTYPAEKSVYLDASGNVSAVAAPTVLGAVYGKTVNSCGTPCAVNMTALGYNAGSVCQLGGATAIGASSGGIQGFGAVAVGELAGLRQSCSAVAIGRYAGTYCVAIPQPGGSVGIGTNAQPIGGSNSIAIGPYTSTCGANSSAIGGYTYSTGACQTHIGPIRSTCSTIGLQGLFYNACSREVIRGAVAAPSSATPTVAGIVYGRTEGCIMMCGSGRTAVGYRAGNGSQGANTVAIGCRAGQVSQGACAVAVGQSAGCSSQGAGAVAIGVLAGAANQGACAVAIGKTASQNSQSSQAVAIGANAGGTCSQGIASIAIGYGSGAAAGCACFPQSPQSVAVGTNARAVSCSVFAVAIGPGANALGAPNSVAIGHCVMASGGCQTHIGPIRPVCSTSGLQGLFYNACTREVIRGSAGGGGSPATPCTAGIVYGRTTTACGCINGKTALGAAAGNCSQGNFAVAVGFSAGVSSQGNQAVAIGQAAGASTQGVSAVAIGASAGNFGQSGAAVAVGSGAGNYTQGSVSVAVGTCAGYYYQGANSVAIGGYAGYFYQGANAVAVGQGAGGCYQSPCTVAIGAGTYANSTASSTHIGPVRNATTAYHLYYCPCSREITYG